MVEHRAARRVEHQRVTAAVARLPDTRAVQEAVHRLAMVAAKADRQRVTVAVVAAVHLQDMAVAAAVHLQDTGVVAKADLQQVTVAVAAAVPLQDMVVVGRARVAVEPVQAVPARVAVARARED